VTQLFGLRKPTLILDEEKAKRNLSYIQNKINQQHIDFRPHFKTHQSAEIGNWFREAGINKITVSSIDMARYFAQNGWNDIFVAFPVNILQVEEIVELSNQIHLSLLFEELNTVSIIDSFLSEKVSGWIKIDTGANRCGLKEYQFEEILALAETIRKSNHLQLKGLVTHAGHSYRYKGKDQIQDIYDQSITILKNIQTKLMNKGFNSIQISVGDTPTARLVDNYLSIDELRPGNFLFYDVQQYQADVCNLDEIAVALACPVVAFHPAQNEIVVYGGAIHLSKDSHKWNTNEPGFGLIALQNKSGMGWNDTKVFGYLRSLSQEHGVGVFPDGIPDSVKPGSIVYVLPAHSCLTVQAMGQFINLDGETIHTMLG